MCVCAVQPLRLTTTHWDGEVYLLLFSLLGVNDAITELFLASLPWFPLGACPWKWAQCEKLGISLISRRQASFRLPLTSSENISQPKTKLSSLHRLWAKCILPKSILCNVSLTWKPQWGDSPKECLLPRGNRPWWQERSMLLFCREVAGLFCHLLWFHFDHKVLGTKFKNKKMQNGNESYFFSSFCRNI